MVSHMVEVVRSCDLRQHFTQTNVTAKVEVGFPSVFVLVSSSELAPCDD